MESSFLFIVDEPTDVVASDGVTVVGRVVPGTQYQGLSLDEHWVTMTGPNGAPGYVPATNIRWDAAAIGITDPPPPPPPPPSSVPELPPADHSAPPLPPAPTPNAAAGTATVGAAPPAESGFTVRRPFTMVSGAVVTLSVFMPWFSGVDAFDIPLGFFLNLDWDGPDGGLILLLCGIGITALAVTQAARPGIVRILGVVVLAAAGSVILQTLGSDFLERVSVGLYAALAGGAAALIAPSRDG